MKDYYISNNN